MRWLHSFGFVVGTGLFATLVVHVGPERLWHGAAALGWGIVLIVAIEGIADFLHTWGWQRCFAPAHRPGPLALWAPHLAGAAINFVTPTLLLGGDVVRGTLVPRDVPGVEATASLVINKLTAMLADVVLLLVALVVVVTGVPLPAEARAGILLAAGAFTAGGLAALRLQQNGRLAGLLGRRRAVARLLGGERAARLSRAADGVDARIAAFHADGRGALAASVALHLAGNLMGAVQLLVFLSWMRVPTNLASVALVFLVARAIDLASFFVPARLGAQEGARMLAMTLVGLDASLGLLFSLALRVEQVAWTAVGLVAYAMLGTSRVRGVQPVS